MHTSTSVTHAVLSSSIVVKVRNSNNSTKHRQDEHDKSQRCRYYGQHHKRYDLNINTINSQKHLTTNIISN